MRVSSPRPVRYYFVDFGMSRRFEPGEPRLMTGGMGAVRSAPELSLVVPCDPFKLDVYLLGNVVPPRWIPFPLDRVGDAA